MGLLDAMLEKGRAEGEARGEARGIAKGKAEGKAKGKAEGQLEAQRRTAEKLLLLKFGPLTDGTREHIASMDRDALDAAIERILDATRIEDVLG